MKQHHSFPSQGGDCTAEKFLSELPGVCATSISLLVKSGETEIKKSSCTGAGLGGAEYMCDAPRAAVVLRVEKIVAEGFR